MSDGLEEGEAGRKVEEEKSAEDYQRRTVILPKLFLIFFTIVVPNVD